MHFKSCSQRWDEIVHGCLGGFVPFVVNRESKFKLSKGKDVYGKEERCCNLMRSGLDFALLPCKLLIIFRHRSREIFGCCFT